MRSLVISKDALIWHTGDVIAFATLHPRRLVCPNACGVVALEKPDASIGIGSGSTTLHSCAAMSGLDVPMIYEGVRAEARLWERQDYEAGDHGRLRLNEDGKPIMAVEVVRDDGSDVAVFAPLASADLGGR